MSFGGQPKTSSTLFATFGGTSVLADSYGAAAKGGWKHAAPAVRGGGFFVMCEKLVNRSFVREMR